MVLHLVCQKSKNSLYGAPARYGNCYPPEKLRGEYPYFTGIRKIFYGRDRLRIMHPKKEAAPGLGTGRRAQTVPPGQGEYARE